MRRVLTLGLDDVEGGEVPGAELEGDEVGESEDLHRDFTEHADDKARYAPRVVSAHLCLEVPGCVYGRAEFSAKFLGGLVVVLVGPVHALH